MLSRTISVKLIFTRHYLFTMLDFVGIQEFVFVIKII